MTTHPDLDARARDVIDGNRYMVLGTLDSSGRPRVSPVYFTHDSYTDFYWVSSPASHHSANVARQPAISIVIFDSSAPIGHGQAVYVEADARLVADAELPERCAAAFAGDLRGGMAFQPEELSGGASMRLYVATATAWDVHVPGRDPAHGTGLDRRVGVDPPLSREA
jgi:hypothetical protein